MFPNILQQKAPPLSWEFKQYAMSSTVTFRGLGL
jgi:hypothetical protein